MGSTGALKVRWLSGLFDIEVGGLGFCLSPTTSHWPQVFLCEELSPSWNSMARGKSEPERKTAVCHQHPVFLTDEMWMAGSQDMVWL